MKSFLDTIFRSFLTGIAISIGAIAFLSLLPTNKLAGAFLFSLGLFIVLNFDFYLFTGKVGYIIENKPSFIGKVVVIWLGNFLGTIFSASLILLTRYKNFLQNEAQKLCQQKNADSELSLLILGFFCGILMFVAADGFKNIKNAFAQVFVVVIPVMVFILCGFEHSIADMFYFSLAKWMPKSFLNLLFITVGNSIGGITIPLIKKLAFLKE